MAKKLAVPANVAPVRPPVCEPKPQPVEPPGPLWREAVANGARAERAELETQTRRRAAGQAEQQVVVRWPVGLRRAIALAG